MTREEAKELFKKSSDFAVYYFDHTEVLSLNQSDIILNQIYDEHEAQMKAKDDEIRRLNNLYADTIKELGDAYMEIERLKKAIDTSIKEVYLGMVKSAQKGQTMNDEIDDYTTFQQRLK